MFALPNRCRTIVPLLMAVGVFAGAGIGEALADTTLDKIKKQGFIEIGYANESPFSYKALDGQVVGVDVDILAHIMGEMGVSDIKASLTKFGSLIPGLKAKRFDMVAAAMYIKPDRCKQVAFAEPLYILGDTIIVPSGNSKNLHSYKDVAADPSLKLGVPVGGTGVSDKALALGVKQEQLVGFNDNPSGMEAVKAGRVDAFAATALIAETQIRAMGAGSGLERAQPFEQPVIDGKIAYGIPSFAVRPEDTEFLAELNKQLLAFRGTPEYVKILEKHGISKDDLPTGETTEMICKG